MSRIERCCICNQRTKNVYNIQFKEVIGMSKEYLQNIDICEKCGFIFTANPFSNEQFERRYKEISKYEYDSSDYCLDEDKTYTGRCERQYKFIKNNISDFNSVLEIGAASGYNLSLYRDYNKDVFGIEPSKINVKLAKDNYDVEMFCGMFEEYLEMNIQKKYDLIFLSHVLEHIVNPSDFIREIRKINNKFIFIEVPSLDCKTLDEPFGTFCEEHVNYFTMESLVNLMQKNGYRLIDMNLVFGNNFRLPAGWPAISSLWIKSEVYEPKLKLVKNSFNILVEYIKTSENEFKQIKALIDKIDDNAKLAVWGTGNHTSKLLGETSLSEKNIVKFYDSDTKKQVYRMMDRNIEKFNPEDITKGEIDTILISTYVFQEEIKEYIDNFNIKCNVITLY
ncbi:class I SAM-dependent methyltransferase [Clostridium sp. LP20]|uniref:class I SAM-dependent methyltransferase n=1 Tax=Clostridium sp. LP20 TaxID=3418665 RepID=UPI003EE5F5C5